MPGGGTKWGLNGRKSGNLERFKVWEILDFLSSSFLSPNLIALLDNSSDSSATIHPHPLILFPSRDEGHKLWLPSSVLREELGVRTKTSAVKRVCDIFIKAVRSIARKSGWIIVSVLLMEPRRGTNTCKTPEPR
jgi:hypothetical protein